MQGIVTSANVNNHRRFKFIQNFSVLVLAPRKFTLICTRHCRRQQNGTCSIFPLVIANGLLIALSDKRAVKMCVRSLIAFLAGHWKYSGATDQSVLWQHATMLFSIIRGSKQFYYWECPSQWTSHVHPMLKMCIRVRKALQSEEGGEECKFWPRC